MRGGAGLYSALLACRTKSTSTINRENPEYNPVTQSRNGNENWTNNNNNNIEEVEKRIAAGLYFCLFMHTLTRGTRHVVVAIVVDREKSKQKIRVQFHTRSGMVQGGMRPWICGDRERWLKCASFKLLNSIFHAWNSTKTWRTNKQTWHF